MHISAAIVSLFHLIYQEASAPKKQTMLDLYFVKFIATHSYYDILMMLN